MVEGQPGVGKTELAKVLSRVMKRDLIRLQCYEGIDETHILYEWAYAKQLLYAEILRGKINDLLVETSSLNEAVGTVRQQDDAFFSFDFLQPRPLLQALVSDEPVVLLIDEVDRSDRETEAFLLEALSDFQVSVPEIGTIQAKHKPFVILTSNNSRELSDALKRRCIYLYIEFPSEEQELEIIKLKVPGLKEKLGEEIISFVSYLRKMEWKKMPSIAESIDWALALVSLNTDSLGQAVVENTINLLLKHKNDLKKAQQGIEQLMTYKR